MNSGVASRAIFISAHAQQKWPKLSTEFPVRPKIDEICIELNFKEVQNSLQSYQWTLLVGIISHRQYATEVSLVSQATESTAKSETWISYVPWIRTMDSTDM